MKHTGRVVWFNNKKGYGFIACPDFDKDVFAHWQNIVSDNSFKTIEKDAMVSFVLGTNDQGQIACNITVIKND